MSRYLRFVYACNIVGAGALGGLSLFAPAFASEAIFHQTAGCSSSIQTAGSMWLGISFLSLCGLARPLKFSSTLILQMFYKSSYLVFSAIPAWRAGRDFPIEMAAIFVLSVVAIPFAIPWKYLLHKNSIKSDWNGRLSATIGSQLARSTYFKC